MENLKPPKSKLREVRRVLFKIFLIVIVFSAGYAVGFKGYIVNYDPYPKVTISRQVPEDKELDFSLFWKVWDTLEDRYYAQDQLVDAKMVYGAISGMVSAVGDPYTIFLPPTENKVVQEDLQGNFEGVGIQIGYVGTQLAVIAPLPDSPAEEAGVQAGDFIVGIKDEEKGIDRGTVGITLPEAVQAIRGPKGTTVTLSLLREGEEEIIPVDIVRASIDVPSVVIEFVGENEEIAHIKVLKFVAETKSEWDKAVIEVLKRPQTKGVIIDVRNNPGGYLQGAVDLASDFLEVGDLVVTEERKGVTTQEFKVTELGRLRNTDVVVLVNKGSASASEIFAGALRDNEEVTIVGQTSFGKGTIQEPQQVENGAGLHITIARWLTPSGYWVDEGGIVPDIEIENNPDTTEDEQLQRAIEEL